MRFFTWFLKRAPRDRAQHRPSALPFRPRLEALEDRTLLSAYTAASVSELIADINAANQNGGTNTITLAANTTFDLTAVNNTTNGANGLPVISGGGRKLAADNLTIVGNGDTIERSTAAGTPAFRLFDVAGGSSLTLENVTLQGGWAFGSAAAADGGAIYNQGTLTLSAATVQGNTAQGSDGAGGAVSKKNQINAAQAGADAAGGGIWSSGTVNLQGGSIVQNNQALGGQGGSVASNLGVNGGAGGGAAGGGLYEAGGNVNASNATLTGNEAHGGMGGSGPFRNGHSGNGGAGSGGGLYVASGQLAMSNDTVNNNVAWGGFGGRFVGGTGVLGGSGGAGSGGGIYVGGGAVTLQGGELLSNRAQGGDGGEYYFTGGVTSGTWESARGLGGNGLGGGLYAGGGTVTLTGDTVTSNAAEAGGSGSLGVSNGSPGVGEGGGLYILPTASVFLDTATLDAILNNIASTRDPDIHGPYSLS